MATIKIENLTAKTTNLTANDRLPLAEPDGVGGYVTKHVTGQQMLDYFESEIVVGTSGDMTKAVYDTDNDGVVDSTEKEVLLVRNSTGSTIPKASVVYINGATGQVPTIALADADTELTSSKTIGLTLTALTNNTNGYIVTSGLFHTLDTSAYADGDSLWLSSTAGQMVANTPPSEPSHSVYIGRVAYSHGVNGKIVVAIQNGYELNELHGVSVSSEVNNDVLRYNSSTCLWENKQLTDKQDALVSGTNIKTIEGQSLLGSGNIDLSKTDVGLSNVDNTSDVNKPISTATQTALNGKQDTLVSATNIKTINSTTLLGSGDLTVQSTLVSGTNIKTVNGTSLLGSGDLSTDPLIPNMKGHETFRGVNYSNNSTTEVTSGGVTMATSASTIARSVASTSYATKQVRKGFYASVVSTGRYTGTRGSALLWYIGGGFRYVCEVYISDTAYGSGCRQFYGLQGSTADLTYTDSVLVSSLINCIGVGSDSADSNLQIFYNDGTGTASKIDLGASFPANRTSGAAMTTIYSVVLYNAPSSSNVIYQVINKETGATTTGTLSSDLPASTQGLNFFASRCMGTAITNTGQFDLTVLGVYSL